MERENLREAAAILDSLAAETQHLALIALLARLKDFLAQAHIEFPACYSPALSQSIRGQCETVRLADGEKDWGPRLPLALRRLILLACAFVDQDTAPGDAAAAREICRFKSQCLRAAKECRPLMEPIWEKYSPEVRAEEEKAFDSQTDLIREQLASRLTLYQCAIRMESTKQEEKHAEALEEVRSQYASREQALSRLDRITARRDMMNEKSEKILNPGG